MSFPLARLQRRTAFDLTETLWQMKDRRNTALHHSRAGFSQPLIGEPARLILPVHT